MTTDYSNKLVLDDVNFKGKRVVMRVDFNVPMKKDAKGVLSVRDAGRIVAAIPSIKHILSKSPRSLVLMSHLGRPRGRTMPDFSLRPLLPVLESLLGRKVIFLTDCVGPATESFCASPPEGSLILLENVRFHVEEVGRGKGHDGAKVKASQAAIQAFRQSLTSLGDIYVNDAFGAAHRAHSSVVGVQLPVRAGGFILARELKAFGGVLVNPPHPFLAILGGAKVRDKLPLIMNLLDNVDELIITGAMAFTFLHVNDGVKIGNSLYDEKGAKLVGQIMVKARERGVQLHFPVDFTLGDKFAADAKVAYSTKEEGIPDGWMALDVGAKTRAQDAKVIWRAKAIVMNGPVGVFEFPAFSLGTASAISAMAAATALGGALSIIGGGDSAAAARKFNLDSEVTHVSTGGGASLELLEGKVLPGIANLTSKPSAKL